MSAELFPDKRLPVIQAPMGGGISTPELAAAVSNAGGLGSVALGYRSPDEIRSDVARTRALTDRPFAVNLFAPESQLPLSGDVERAKAVIAQYHLDLGLAAPTLPDRAGHDFSSQMKAVLEARVAIVSFTFGFLPEDSMRQLRAQGAYVIGTATTVEEAVLLERRGVDAVVAQGSEAGAHRGTFHSSFEAAQIGTMALVPQMVDAVRVPVIASGGIMDGRGVVAALALGAIGVQMGTAFLLCDESGAPEAYKSAVLSAREEDTALTRAFSGRFARGIRNRVLDDFEQNGLEPLPYPWQNSLTREMRRAAGAAGRPEFLSLWAGQGVRMGRRLGAAELMNKLREEIAAARATIASLGSG